MTLGWKPDQKALKSYAFAQGVSVSLFTPELIAAFTCHHSAHPETHDTAAGWTNKLVGWARRERVRTEPSRRQSQLRTSRLSTCITSAALVFCRDGARREDPGPNR
ncbi:DnaT-like ssDNA-binding domain-containing protein [Pseudomonas asiatica]|uniref:DnaT-like ssDNA-binding domain-containing protein n=1 Tax=Pseudomonas asiatica TaxID=2219225 RepID=UPI003365623C